MSFMEPDNIIGRRVKEIRTWRELSLRTVAGLAGISAGHLSHIEHGTRRVDKRSTLEALAAALNVAPAELAATPFPPRDDVAAEARAAVGMVEAAVADIRLDDPVEITPRPWPEIAADLNRLNSDLRPRADYAAQGMLLPKLIEELHAIYATDPQHRTDALIGLATCYSTAAWLNSNLGIRGLGQLAADRQVTVTDRLARPEWIAQTAWVRALMMGGAGRERQLARLQRSIAQFDREPLTPELLQAIGQLYLAAALACASMGRESETWEYFREAEALADRQEAEVGDFGNMWFGRTNVRIWQVCLATELGYGGKVAELARGARPEELPSPIRQAVFYADLGRAMAQDRRTRVGAVQMLRRAEDLAPQRVRNMPFVRETVIDLLQRSQSNTTARELRGMAHRFGVAG
jgi:transcriptional regulator with XRE-family HTH domain